jgi:lysine 2,3-aminomutase
LHLRDYKSIKLWENVTPEEWNSWSWQIKNRIMDVTTLENVLPLSVSEKNAIVHSLDFLRMAITPYYASLIDPGNPHDPIRIQAVPTAKELEIQKEDMLDPLHEDVDSPVPGLTHRYPDRVLLLLTDMCSMYCRHCTRRRKAGEKDSALPLESVDAAIEYIKEHKEVRDVLLSGGDPFTLPTDYLEKIIAKIAAIPSVEMIRIGTRTPVVLPQRIDEKLVTMLKRYHPIWINTHFNHPKEMTPDSERALAMLADGGIPLGNQSVLLSGVNDNPEIMKKLVHLLVKNRVRPYYIYQCDLSRGLHHFRTTVAKGLEIMEYLRGHTSGLAVPTYVIDAPYGGGKIPVMPQYLISIGENKVVLRNYEGGLFVYDEPKDYHSKTDSSELLEADRKSMEGVSLLLSGDKKRLVPEETKRLHRVEEWKKKHSH